MIRKFYYKFQHEGKELTVIAWTEQVKCRGLSEQLIDIRVVTKSCNIKVINGITWINPF